jgi:hypothetical protein
MDAPSEKARKIAAHSWEEHAREFRNLYPPVDSEEDLAYLLDQVMESPSIARQEGGKTFYFDDATGTILVVNPRVDYGGTAYIGDEDEYWRAH